MSNLSNREGLWLLAGAVVAAIIYFSYGSFPPSSEDVAGTIGGVKRRKNINPRN